MGYPKRLHFLSHHLPQGIWVSKCLEFSLISHGPNYSLSMAKLFEVCAKYLEIYDSQRPSSSLYNRARLWDWIVFYWVTMLKQINISLKDVRVTTIHDHP
jgi:hypothetical protein